MSLRPHSISVSLILAQAGSYLSKNIGTGKFFLEGQVTEEEAKKLVKKTIKRLQQVESPSLNTIKL